MAATTKATLSNNYIAFVARYGAFMNCGAQCRSDNYYYGFAEQFGSEMLSNAMNIGESRRNRRFQRDMSNTAHQREVADLRAAGLNPILSARLGGASTPGGSAAHIQQSQVGQTLANSMMTKAQLDNIKSTTDLNTAQAAQVRAMTPGAPGKQAAETANLSQSTAESMKRIEQLSAQIKNLNAQTETESVRAQKEKALSTLYKWAEDLLKSTDKPVRNSVKKIVESYNPDQSDYMGVWKKRFEFLWKKFNDSYYMKRKRGGR